jgi:lipopolysaccharide transport system ATP-binding protein
LLGLQEREIGRLMPEIEAFAEIGEYIDQPVRVYSSGMQVRLAFAVATVMRPDILIVDEALSVGDAYFQHKCFSRIRKFQELGTTLLFVSHDLAAVRALCAKAIWLDNGAVREFGETKVVLDAYATASYAKKQDVDNAAKQSAVKDSVIKETPRQRRDCRLDFINNSNLRNDIRVFEFNANAARWGAGLAKITATYLQDINGTPLSWIIGGEEVVLTIEALALQELSCVIVGFMVRDRLGQNLFGDNNYLTTIDEPVNIRANRAFRGEFNFLMPILPQGTYAITAAIVTGTQQDHVVHEWVNEALFFESHNGFAVSGLVGVPMHSIKVNEVNSIGRKTTVSEKPIG